MLNAGLCQNVGDPKPTNSVQRSKTKVSFENWTVLRWLNCRQI